MSLRIALCGALAWLAIAPGPSLAQPAPAAGAAPGGTATAAPGRDLYMPRNVRRAYALGTRAADGTPGPKYWQNTARYDIDITVAPPSRRVSARQTVTYVNHSPYPLPNIVFKTYLNIHKPEAVREDVVTPAFLNAGVSVDEFRINGAVKDWHAQPGTQGITWRNVTLDQPLAPGGSITFSFAWSYELSTHNWKEGVVDDTTFYLAYFFPRVAVIDDIDLAFDTQEFSSLNREFNNDFSDFTFTVRVPKNFAVWATGDLVNPSEVLQPAVAARLQSSLTSDAVVTIATPDDMRRGVVTAQSDVVAWKWQAANVPDIAIAVSDHYVWDAGSLVVDPATGRRASVQAAYNVDATDFRKMVEFAKHSLAFGSTRYPGVPYPYSKMTVVRGDADEEYPMMANDASVPGDAGFTDFVAGHEILHSWFPFHMGINEQRYPHMDEGWTTAFEHLFVRDEQGVAAAEALYAKFRTNTLAASTADADLPIVTPFDALKHGGYGFANNAYIKPALAYLSLRDLLGDAVFTRSLHEFIRRWNGKRPSPWDMFNTFSHASGTDLRWFFERWFFEPSYIDIAIDGAAADGTSHAVTVRNVGGAPIPFGVEVAFADGSTTQFPFGAGTWRDAPVATVRVPTPAPVTSITLKSGIFADFIAQNNTWERR